MPRQLADWLSAYLDYTSGTEAPRMMHFWCGVSSIAAVLRRKVWIDMVRFKWYPNFYIILTAPPGIVSKTTTMDLGLDLVRQVPGIKFGPDTVTWQALVKKFAESQESFDYDDGMVPMSAITLASGELGSLINPQDREMVNLYITLWDARSSFEKVTKGNGSDVISAPWINMIGCTTPHWIADNMPRATIGGGFTSRCVFVYADKKAEFVAYPDETANAQVEAQKLALIHDLEWMSVNLVGPVKISSEAREWGRDWYKKFWSVANKRADDDQLDGYLARKQTHMHKLAMILSISRGDELEISAMDLQVAEKMLGETEQDLDKVFSRIGRSEESMQAERFIAFIKRHGRVSYTKAYQFVHNYFPDARDFTGVVEGAIKSGQVKLEYTNNSQSVEHAYLVYVGT